MQILKESPTRQEYKRRWKSIARARQKGLNIDLIERFYAAMRKLGYDKQTTIECLLYCAKNGAFGFVNGWER